YHSSRSYQYIPSFPTRRSSDLRDWRSSTSVVWVATSGPGMERSPRQEGSYVLWDTGLPVGVESDAWTNASHQVWRVSNTCGDRVDALTEKPLARCKPPKGLGRPTQRGRNQRAARCAGSRAAPVRRTAAPGLQAGCTTGR